MSIIASAPVPAGNRLIDADTADLRAVTRPRPADVRFPVNPVYRSIAGDHAATCPTWCPGDCTPEVTLAGVPVDIDPAALNPDEYFDRCRMHERFIANVPSVDAAIHSRHMHTAVEMERFDGPDGKIVEDTSITVAVMPTKPQPGDDYTKVRLTPDQAEKLGQALLDAVRQARA